MGPSIPARPYDVVVLSNIDLCGPGGLRILKEVRLVLSPQGLLLVTTAKSGGRDPRQAIHLLLLTAGFGRVWFHEDNNLGLRRRLAAMGRKGGHTITSAQQLEVGTTPRVCSIVVPVYNERETVSEVMEALLAKDLDHLGLTKEIILVESNSTDGTRELVAAYENVTGVRVIYQQKARGKGNAVREGFRAATGDIVLIQDADLEYDMADYDALLAPLVENRAAFVLGARLGGKLKMRTFEDQLLLGHVLNLGQVFFTGLVNILYGQRMVDPFTMFKVFRRDCLYGLRFECNRFDFDHELVIKLILKGFTPLEVPVRYRSRSFKQGKKVSIVRDVLTWLKADFKFRFCRLRPHFD
jgi:hypothetical protein